MAIVTPMKDNYEVNYEKLDEILEAQLREEQTVLLSVELRENLLRLPEAEHLEKIRFTIDRVNHRIL